MGAVAPDVQSAVAQLQDQDRHCGTSRLLPRRRLSSLVHCSEVGIWKATLGKTPSRFCGRRVRECFRFHDHDCLRIDSQRHRQFLPPEYDAAKRGLSQFESMFVAWYEIDQYSAPVADTANSHPGFSPDVNATPQNACRSPAGRYLWWLWNGAPHWRPSAGTYRSGPNIPTTDLWPPNTER